MSKRRILMMFSAEASTRLALQPCHPKQRTETIRPASSRFLWHGAHRLWMFLVLVTLLSIGIPCSEAQVYNRPFTPPPQTGNKPVVSNNIVYFINYIPVHCQEPYVSRYPAGGIVNGKRALLQRDNPHDIHGNIEIPSNSCLWIEPGCELRFGPGYGIIVNGTLIARGSEEPGGRITMTKLQGQDTGAPTGDWKYDARLSDGNTTQDGRLDLMYQDKWRAICTNYQNFTEMDVNVTCRHLGFLKGNFTYHSFARNLTNYMLWDKPGCTGNENSLFECPGVSRIRVGAHICDGQQVVGFECEGLRPGLAEDHWRGIEFFNSTSHRVRSDDNIFMEESWSWLEYLDLSYPGLDIYHGRTSEPGIYYPIAAISASPLVPLMNNVTIRYGAYDGFNLTEVSGPIHIANSTVHKCRGNGIFIQTAVGVTLINTTTVTENWGDGIKFYISNLTIHDFRQNFTFNGGFCFRPDSSTYSNYPTFEHVDAVSSNGDKLGGRSCKRSFSTTKDKSVNLHFLLMEKDPEASGKLIVEDGAYGTDRVIGTYDVANGTFPQSVRTRTQTMIITFEYKLPRGGCKVFKPCLRFLLRLSTSNGTEDEFRMIYSKVSDNIGYGVNIQNIRSKVFFNTSEVSRNQFGAGIRVYQGAGEVIINSTRLEGNADCGINITYSGGYQLINNTELIRNRGYGIITEYLLLNRSRIENMQKLEIVRGRFMFNEFIGLRVGNYCRGGSVFVNESHFNFNLDEAIEYLSCNISTGDYPSTNFSVSFTEFEGNVRHAILMKPLLNTVGIISNCTFTNHSLGTLRVDNGYDLLISKWYRQFPVEYNIFQNQFKHNSGRYVVSLRLTDKSPRHKMYFKFNTLTDNSIQESFIYTNPRSRANAVAVVSSGNVVFKRNILKNRKLSVREMATHLVDPSVIIDATENFWGIEVYQSRHYEVIHNTIFDQDDRYNLAHFNFKPALQNERVYEDELSIADKFRWSFDRPNNVIGGFLDYGGFSGRRGETYYVDRDIYVFPGQVITLPPQVTLEFAPSVGMVVHGVLKADGENAEGTIRFKLWTDPDLLPLENRTASVRLSSGTDLYEGRLEVFINDEWGTVCNEGWTEKEAALVCLQLGLIYNPQQGQASVREVAPPGIKVLMSWVSCDEADVDLTRCRAILSPEVSCDHSHDVYLRCQDPTWAGITLPATPRLGQGTIPPETQLRNVHLERAGLLDSEMMSFTPALRIDYNYYIITAVTITDSLSDGVLINYNYPYETPRLEYMQIHNNLGNGVVTRYPRLDLRHSSISNCKKAGFLYDPFFSEYDALSVQSMIHETKRTFITNTPSVQVPSGGMFLLCPPGDDSEDHHEYNTEISTSSMYRIVVQLLDYFPVTEIEEVTVFDSRRANIGSTTNHWRIPQDLVDFPLMSSSNHITIRLTVKGIRSGRLAFAIIPQRKTDGRPDLTTHLFNNTFRDNYQGLQTRHYNNPSNRRLEVFHRFQLETIFLERINILQSKKEAIFMPSVTKFSDDYIPTYEDMTRPERVATIRYNITQGIFKDNAAGILAEHNHVDFANNVWQWRLHDTRLEGTRSGGVQIEVPRVNNASERAKHSVTIIESKFRNNKDFSFAIKGYYADVRVENNRFENNDCLMGLMTISGMEKNLSLISNYITNNVGRYMLDLNILSHSEYSETVSGIMEQNEIRSNRHRGLMPVGLGPKTYAMAFRGVQNMTAHKNLLNNPDLEYELVAGVTALSLGNPLDVRRNFWGQTFYVDIMKRIFDFDDWNSYSIAEFFPFLTADNFDADLSVGEPEPPLDTTRLGGRVLEDQILAYRSDPYIVERDLTIMPEATLTISAGSELQFRPNVGILVLGRLIARGVEYNRIRMRSVQPGADPFLLNGNRKKRAATSTVRLRGDKVFFKNSGFLEMFNTSTKTWNIMCDSQFNEKSAEVVCRQLGLETVNVRVRYTHLYDFYIYGEPQYFLKEFWFESYFCRGDETDLKQCTTRYNYNLQQCIEAANYTFIQCGETNLDPGLEHWGNLRFARNAYQELSNEIGQEESILEYVDIEGAGMLHGEKVGAIQTTYVSPQFRNINITKCAENGLDIIAPRGNLNMRRLHVSNNLGFGFNFLILNGESNTRDSSFVMLGSSTIPYHVYGLVEICRMEKEIVLETRIILYYKYGPAMRDCVKIIRSENPRKQVGVRFLQVNMFHEDFSRNMVEIFDGSAASIDTRIKEIVANTSSEDLKQLYTSSGDTLAIHLHASVSHGSYGFIAEVVQVPLSLTGLPFPNTDYQHQISQSISSRNQDGALQYKNVGEGNPSFFVDQCWIEDNGVAILNLTSPPTIDISLQGTVLFRFASNSVSNNKGGMYMHTHTQSRAIALRGNITNNIFSFGTNGEALNITGHYYQHLYMFQNYIFNYTAGDWRDVIHIRDVLVNFTFNYMDNNTGNYILNTFSSDTQQLFTRSGFTRNNATALVESTIKIGGGRPFFENNYIVNEDNDFEMETYPKIGRTHHTIDARNNWWGSNLRSYINGKLWENADNPSLMPVTFWQPKLDNRSVVAGQCPPGWLSESNRCYRFMGGALPYFKAQAFCREVGAFLAQGRDREGFLNYLLRLMRNMNDFKDRVWIMSEVGSSRCAAFEYSHIVYEEDCWNLLYPFICEKNPYLTPPPGLESSVRAMTIGIGAGIGGVLILVFVILGILWCVKSKRREKERFERTASMRSSMRMSKSTLTNLSEGHSRRRLNEIDAYSQASSGGTKASRGTEDLNGSVASLSHGYRNGRAAVIPDRGLADRRGTERDRWQDRERDRERDGERELDMRRGRRYQRDYEEQEESGESRGKEDSESEEEKKGFEDSEEEEDSFNSEPEEGEEEEASGGRRPEDHLYQNNAAGVPLPGMGRSRSRDNVYENEEGRPARSKPLKSFSQPTDPHESPVANIYLRRPDLPTPPPTPRAYGNIDFEPQQYPPEAAPKPRVAPKPAARPPLVHPGVDQLRHSPAPSEGSASGRPSPLPRKNFDASWGSPLRETPVPHEASDSYPNYQNHTAAASPHAPKPPVGSMEFLPRSKDPSEAGDFDYKPSTPHMSPSNRLPNLPRYSPPLPMEGPPSYEESDPHYPYSMQQPDYLSQDPPASYHPSLDEAPQQDVQYLPRYQPDQRHFHDSRDRMGGSRDRMGGSRDRLDGNRGDRLGGSRDRLDGSRDRMGGSRDRLDGNRGDRLGGSQDRLDGSRDRMGGSRDRLDRNRRDRLGGSQDRLDGSRDRLGGSREYLQGSRDQLNINQPGRSPAAAYPPGVMYLNNDEREGGSHLETEI